jgi:dTDP-glucose 4,6-dehydratase
LTEALLDLGAQVYILVRKAPGELVNLAPVKDRLIHLYADLRNYAQIASALQPLREVKGIVVFHLAAQAHVGQSWQSPEITLESNVLGTLNLLKAIRDLGLDLLCFDYAGSSEEYGSFDPARASQYRRRGDGAIILDEEAPLNPKSIYATSKVAGDFLSRNFFDAYGLPVIVTRMFNNFGPRQGPKFITGTVISQALSREVVEIGRPTAKRDFTYVADGVRGHLLATLKLCPGDTCVFGQGKNMAIGDWARMILDVGAEMGFWAERQLVVRPELFRPGTTDDADLLADSTLLHGLTGWQPAVSWEEGIVRTIKWYVESLNGKHLAS